MNQEIKTIKNKNHQKLLFFMKFYLSVIKIQRIFRKHKVKVKTGRNIKKEKENDIQNNVNNKYNKLI
jgi:hypothetical protein